MSWNLSEQEEEVQGMVEERSKRSDYMRIVAAMAGPGDISSMEAANVAYFAYRVWGAAMKEWESK